MNRDNNPDKTEHSVPCRLTGLKGGVRMGHWGLRSQCLSLVGFRLSSLHAEWEYTTNVQDSGAVDHYSRH